MTRALLTALLFATSLRAATLESAARDYLTLAVAGRFDALPRAEGAAQLEARIRGIERVRCPELVAMAIKATGPDVVEAELALKGYPVELIPLRLHLLPKGDSWMVASIDYPAEELAAQLIAAKKEERPALYDANRERLTAELARVLYTRAVALVNSRDAAKAPEVGVIMHEVAFRSGDASAESLAYGIDTINARIRVDPTEGMRVSAASVAFAEESGNPDVIARAWQNRSRLVAMDNIARKVQTEEADRASDLCLANALRYAEQAEDPTILVRVLENLAINSAQRGDFFSSRRYQERLLPIAVEIHDHLGEIGYELQVANLYFDQGDHDLALFHHRRGLELAKQYDPRRYPYFLIRLGGALVEEKRYDEARALFREAVPRDERGAIKLALNSLSPNMASFALQQLAIMAAESGQLDDAECLIDESGAILPKIDGRRFEFLLAPYFAKRGDHAAALRLSLQTLQERPVAKPDDILPALMSAARAYRGLGDSRRAMDLALEILANFESRYPNVGGGSDQQILAGSDISAAYELAAGIAIDEGKAVDALAFLEQGRGRILRESLEHGKPNELAHADEAEQAKLRREEAELARLNVALGKASGDARAAAKLKAQLATARLAYRSSVDGAATRAERLSIAGRRITASNLPELLRALPAGMCGVEYFIEDDQLHVFVIRDGRVVVRKVEVSREALDREVKRYVAYVAKNDLRFAEPAKALYALLIAPVEKDLRGAGALLVIPDKMLWKVSFASLIDARGRFVVERWATVHAPAVAVYGDMLAGRRKAMPEAPTLLAIGNPTLDRSSAAAFATFYRDAAIGPLPEAEREVRELRSLYGKDHTHVLERAQATEGRVKAEIGGADVVHFATHALLDDVNPMYSRLALAREAGGVEDGWLETWEVARLHIGADLVVLSACETASGRVAGGEGAVGLTWSFFVAGARSTVATEWKVESEATARFMVAFHAALRSAQDPTLRKARALRTAQLRFLRDPRYRHPFYWAGFVLFGSAN